MAASRTGLTTQNSMNCGLMHAVHPGQLTLRVTACLASDFVTLSVRKLRAWTQIPLEGSPSRSSLGRFVEHIFRLGSQEQVPRVHAWWVVAGVADVQPFGDGSNEHFIRHAMSARPPYGRRTLHDHAIPGSIFPASIRPALVLRKMGRALGEESVSQRCYRSSHANDLTRSM